MSGLAMIFIFPIGVAFFIFELKYKKAYENVFESFFEEVRANDTLNNSEKIAHVQKMYEKNSYHILSKSEREIVAEKKIFSVGLFFMGLGMAYIGAALYLAYYFWIKKAHQVRFSL